MKEEEKLIQNIVKIRSSKGLTKRSMSEALNINEASYGRIENGKVALSYSPTNTSRQSIRMMNR